MTISWPEPLPDAPLTARSLANLNLATRAAEVSDSARGFVPFPGGGQHDGTLFTDALRFLARAEELVAAAVIVERAHGVSWDDLAEAAELAKSTVYTKWSPAAAAWEQRLRDADRQALRDQGRPDIRHREMLGATPERTAEGLDRWMAQHAGPGEVRRAEKPGSALVERMDPLAESNFLSAQRSRLLEDYMVPPPALMAPLAERAAVVEDALAEFVQRPTEAAGHRANAARNRAYAADLQRQADEGAAGSDWPGKPGPAADDPDVDEHGGTVS